MKVGDLIKVFQVSSSSFNQLLDHWVPIYEGLLVDHFTDDDIDKGVACILDKTGTIRRIDLSQYRTSQVNKKRMLFKVEVISEA